MFIEKCNGGLPYWVDESAKEVREKFPCPKGYRELEFGEDLEFAIDRLTLKEIKVSRWSEWGAELYDVTQCGVGFFWFVAKI